MQIINFKYKFGFSCPADTAPLPALRQYLSLAASINPNFTWDHHKNHMIRLMLFISFIFASNSLLSQSVKEWIVNDIKTGEFEFVQKQDTTWIYNYDSQKNIISKKEPIFVINADAIPQKYKLLKNGNNFIMKIFNYKNKKSFTDTFAVMGNLESRYFPELTHVIDKIENISYGSRVEYDRALSIGKYYVFNIYSSGHSFGDGFCNRYFFTRKGLYLDKIEYFKRKGFDGKWIDGFQQLAIDSRVENNSL